MAGLRLMTTLDAGGSYTNSSPYSATAASTPGHAGIGQKAYGVNSTGQGLGPRTAFYGGTGIGLAAIAGLIFLWYSLPR